MSYILKDILKCFNETISPDSYLPEAFEESRSIHQREFWQYLFGAAGENDLPVSDSQASRWTRGKTNFNPKYLKVLESNPSEITKAIREIIESLQKDELSKRLSDIFESKNIYSLLDLGEDSDLGHIIYCIITNYTNIQKSITDSTDNNLYFRNLPYSTTYKNIIPIEAVQNFFCETLQKYHYAIVYGISGIGKLCQAVYYVIHNNPTYYYYLEFEQSIQNTFSHYDFKNMRPTPMPQSENALKKQFNKWKKELNTVLIINNIGENIQNDPDFFSLINLPIKIIFLTTYNYSDSASTIAMPNLEINQCIDLFYNNCPRQKSFSESNDSALKAIIDKIERHTLSLELIAKLIQNSSLNLEDILDQINRNFLIDSGTFIRHQEMDGSEAKKTYKDFILNLFDIENVSQSYCDILHYVSLLPRNGYSRISFNMLSNDLESNKINDLIDLGLIQLNEHLNTIRLHPLIQSCLLQKLEPTPTSCLPFLKNYVTCMDTQKYGNETESILLGISILEHLQDDSQQWFEISYMILNLLRRERLDYSTIKKLLDKLNDITFYDDINQLKNFYIQHVNIMYQLYKNQTGSILDETVKLADEVLDFCERKKVIPSFTLIDMMISMSNNFKELFCRTEDSIFNYYCIKLLIEKNNLIIPLANDFLSYDKCFEIISIKVKNDINMILGKESNTPNVISIDKLYWRGLHSLYSSDIPSALNSFNEVYEYYKCHLEFQFRYSNLHCQYLILYCQKELGYAFDRNLITSLKNALQNLPEPKKDSSEFKQLMEDIHGLLSLLEELSDEY